MSLIDYIRNFFKIAADNKLLIENELLKKENERLKLKDNFEDMGEFLLKRKKDGTFMEVPFCPKCLLPMNWYGKYYDSNCPDCKRVVDSSIYLARTQGLKF